MTRVKGQCVALDRGSYEQGDHGDANAGAGMDIYGFVCSFGCVAGAFVRGVFRFDGKGPVFRS